jgi:hypothetical protein
MLSDERLREIRERDDRLYHEQGLVKVDMTDRHDLLLHIASLAATLSERDREIERLRGERDKAVRDLSDARELGVCDSLEAELYGASANLRGEEEVHKQTLAALRSAESQVDALVWRLSKIANGPDGDGSAAELVDWMRDVALEALNANTFAAAKARAERVADMENLLAGILSWLKSEGWSGSMVERLEVFFGINPSMPSEGETP